MARNIRTIFALLIIAMLLIGTMHYFNSHHFSNNLMSQERLNDFRADLLQTLALAHSEPSDINGGQEIVNSVTIMPHMLNNTIRADLGKATWRLLHTMAVS